MRKIVFLSETKFGAYRKLILWSKKNKVVVSYLDMRTESFRFNLKVIYNIN